MSPDNTAIPHKKRCSRCGTTKPLSDFVTRSRAQDGKAAYCKQCSAADKLEYREKNRERERERVREWKINNHEKHKTARRRQYANRREHYNSANQAWKRNNPDRVRVYTKTDDQKRRAIEKGLPASFSTKDWQIALDYFSGSCAVCGRSRGLWHTLAADHWIPLNSPDCPGTVPWNIVPLCHGIGGCNNRKKARPAQEFLVEVFGKRRGTAILNRVEAFLESRRGA